jgi:hypothetical protein
VNLAVQSGFLRMRNRFADVSRFPAAVRLIQADARIIPAEHCADSSLRA